MSDLPNPNPSHVTIRNFLHRWKVLGATLDVARMAGAEWWLQDTDGMDPPKEFHTDVNIQVRGR